MYNMGGCIQQVCESALTARAARKLIAEGAAGIVATDAHDYGAGGPCMTAAFEMLSASLGPRRARLLCIENPARVLAGEGLVPIPLGERQGIW